MDSFPVPMPIAPRWRMDAILHRARLGDVQSQVGAGRNGMYRLISNTVFPGKRIRVGVHIGEKHELVLDGFGSTEPIMACQRRETVV